MTKVQMLPVAKIDRNPKQPRERFPEDHIERLARSIKKRGLIQPITVRPKPAGRFEIIAGECRWRAHKLLGKETIKAIVAAADDRETQLQAIVENLQRQDMNPIEEARAFKLLLDDGYSVQQIVDELGLKSQAIVRQRLDLLDLAPDFQQLVMSGQLAVNMAWGVAQAPKDFQQQLIREINSGKLKTSEQVKHAGIAFRDAVAQLDAFASAPAPSKKAVEAMTRLESKIESITEMVSLGFKDGDCIAGQRISPEKVKTMADKLALIRKHVQQMEHDLRRVAIQAEIAIDVGARAR